MKSRNTYSQDKRGFTLIEVLIVIGILTIVAGAGMAFGFDAYRGYLFRAEHTGAAHILMSARNKAMGNFDEEPHGVKVTDDSYVLFSGTLYDPTDTSNIVYPKNEVFSIDGMETVIFEQLSGNVLSCIDHLGGLLDPCSITFDGGGARFATLTIYESGGIIQN